MDLKGNDVQHLVFSVLVRPRLKGSLMVWSLNNYSLYYSPFSGLLHSWINPKKKKELHWTCEMKNVPFAVFTNWIDLIWEWPNENIPQLDWNVINIESGGSWP